MFGWKKKGKEGAGTESESEAPRADVKVKVKDRKNCAVLLAVEVPADQVRKATEDSFRRVQSRAKLPGFRPGKAPMEMVKKNFQDAAWEDALDRLLRESVYSAVTQENVVPITTPVVDKIDGQYRVFLNDTGVPRLRLSRTYQELARDRKKLTTENREFITSRLNSANWLIQAIEQRRQTMLKVMNFIVDRQREFFEKGIEYLKPLTLREVAEVINMHESTVSRVTNEKYVQTPRGVFELKFFFSSALTTASGEDASARSISAASARVSGRPSGYSKG